MNEKQYRPDWGLFVVTLALLSFGVIMVFDASYPHAIEMHGDKAYFFKKQALWAVIGLVAMFGASKIRFWKWSACAVPALVISILMLIAVKFLGHGAQGAQRWIGYGPIRIQPSEFAKLGIVLYLARVLSARPKAVTDLWKGVVPIFAVTLIAILLVERQPDLGTAITMLLTAVIIFFAAGTRPAWVAGLLLLCMCGGFIAVIKDGTDNYRFKRLTTFVDPGADALRSGYQIIHSTIALGTGGVTGLGFGESREKRLGNLPAQRTDFIFAIIGEEFGLAGTCSVLILFLVLGARGLHIGSRTRDPFGSLLATGITAMISVQALVNIGVVSASIPATGVPLPFISYGGSSLVPTLLGIGILLNISQYPFRTDPKPSSRRKRAELADEPAPRPAARARATTTRLASAEREKALR
jgi:cell division protein FtsW